MPDDTIRIVTGEIPGDSPQVVTADGGKTALGMGGAPFLDVDVPPKSPAPSKVPEPKGEFRIHNQPNSEERAKTEQSLQPAPPNSTPIEPDVPLNSERGVDYTQLRDLLATGKWKEADEETAKKMLEVAGRTEEGWLREEDVDRFTCADLRTIDQLWVKYSNGRFGFSVQKRIYESLGGTREYDRKIWQAFGDRVGWRVNKKWLYYKDVKFNTKAPEGHLPMLWGVRWWVERMWGFGGGEWEGNGCHLFSRVETCKV